MALCSIAGELYLRQIYNVIANNKEWLFSSMDIHGILPEIGNDAGGVCQFIPDIRDHSDQRSQASANPLALHNKIGNSIIDFVSRMTICIIMASHLFNFILIFHCAIQAGFLKLTGPFSRHKHLPKLAKLCHYVAIFYFK